MEAPASANADSSCSFCPSHPLRPCRYICLDISCNQDPLGCILCIKNKHQNCDDKFLMERSSLTEKIRLKNISGTEMENFKEDIRKIMQEMHAYLTQKYKKYMGETLNYLASDSLSLEQLSSVETLKGLKENCTMVVKDEGIIEVCPKIDPTKPSIKEDLRTFKEDIRTLMDSFSKNLNEIRFTSMGSISLKDFSWHKNLSKFK